MVPEYYRWEKEEIPESLIEQLASETGYSHMITRLLIQRGIRDAMDVKKFFDVTTKNMYHPFLMKDMEKAVDRIILAINRCEKITIYGDYDVDGITATSILYLFFQSIGVNIDYYLPDRMTEGYGVNEAAVRKIKDSGTDLMITVDTGITACHECRVARELGLDVIITDHHECQDELPDAIAVIDAKQPGETYPFLYLAGCGVAYKLVQGITEKYEYEGDIEKYLELAAIGTIADIVPLYDENRIIARIGFQKLKNPEIRGVYHLLKSAGYDFHRKITSGMIGFNIAPRLNAGGRMGDAQRGVKLFVTENEREAIHIAEELAEENEHRKNTERNILEEVCHKIEESDDIQNQQCMVIAGKGWHHGVIGIVSSRIKDQYYRPNIILSIENGIAVGSARSIEGFNLFDALNSCKDLMIKFGGHAAAAGLSLQEDKIPLLAERLNEYARIHMTDQMMIPVMKPELILNPGDLTIDLIEQIEQMEPYGAQMPEPTVVVKGLLEEVKVIGKDLETLKIGLRDEKQRISAIGFKKKIYHAFYNRGMFVSISGHVGINEYMGNRMPQLYMQDIHGEWTKEIEKLMMLFSLRKITKGYERYVEQQPKTKNTLCASTYQLLRQFMRRQNQKEEGYLIMMDFPGDQEKTAVQRVFECLQALYVFEELELLKVEARGVYMHYTFVKDKRAQLTDSEWYNRYFI